MTSETISPEQWQPLARALADKLPAGQWVRSAFERVPRHVFTSAFYGYEDSAYRHIDPGDAEWLTSVYADEALTTQVSETELGPRGTSSSSQPSLMAVMLEALDLAEGMRVLESGTGTGYNAALLCCLLGEDAVVSADIDRGLVEVARKRLDRLGYRPALIAGNGPAGCPDRAPFDRVIATHAVERIPYAWVEQTHPGGVILADVRSVGAPGVGHLARLTVREDGTADGEFDVASPGVFMPDRNDLELPQFRGRTEFDLRDAATRRSGVGGGEVRNPGFAFALWAALPDMTLRLGPEVSMSTQDGSWAIVPDGPGEARVAGDRDLWSIAEHTYAQWVAAGRPCVQEYRIRVGPAGQRIDFPT
ncbi:methyltransferase domain-containing protein [Nocardiopsis rhodophaea]|uniref:methyltransferase domain-containing protein n=1 Tax=Nocardiopsis rhodophaea TaxID=280238 RepID=UPI0031E0F82D